MDEREGQFGMQRGSAAWGCWNCWHTGKSIDKELKPIYLEFESTEYPCMSFTDESRGKKSNLVSFIREWQNGRLSYVKNIIIPIDPESVLTTSQEPSFSCK